jgi:MOSC domain-containing protein YiiM
VVSAITRCPATQVKPSRPSDLDIVGTLQRTFGHNLMGVYGEVLQVGEMAVGDPITVANT